MPRLLTSHHSRFTQDGLFFCGLLGLVACGSRVQHFVLGRTSDDDSTPVEPVAEAPPPVVLYCFLGMVSLQKHVLALVRSMAAEAELPDVTPQRRPLRGDLLK